MSEQQRHRTVHIGLAVGIGSLVAAGVAEQHQSDTAQIETVATGTVSSYDNQVSRAELAPAVAVFPTAPIASDQFTVARQQADRLDNAFQATETLPPPPNPIPHYDIWLALAECESGTDWTINTHNGFYGGLQFTKESWDGAGGQQYAEWPQQAAPAEQMMTAEVLLDIQGWGA